MSDTLQIWLKEAEESLLAALNISKDGSVPLQNLYMLAPIIYSERQNTRNEALIKKMIDANDRQVKEDWSHDERSKDQYKFHFVSSYLFCFVVAGKINELKYDETMDYVNSKMDLFTSDYSYQ